MVERPTLKGASCVCRGVDFKGCAVGLELGGAVSGKAGCHADNVFLELSDEGCVVIRGKSNARAPETRRDALGIRVAPT